jgi:hypothetical protein
VSLSNDGETVAIGAPGANVRRGRVRVYRHGASDWIQLGNDIELLTDGVYDEVSVEQTPRVSRR